MRRVARIGAWVALASLLLAVAAVGVLAVRLSRGPIELSFLKRHLERAIATAADAPHLKIESIQLGLSVERHRIELQLHDVVVENPDGSPLLSVTTVAVLPSLRSLWEGKPRIAVAEVLSPALSLVREPDGSLRVHQAGGAKPAAPPAEGLPLLAAVCNPEALPPALRMRRFAILDASVTLSDAVAGTTWKAEHLDLQVHRNGARTEIAVQGDLLASQSLSRLVATAACESPASMGNVHAELTGFVPSAWQGLAAALADVDLPISADLDAAVDGELRPTQLRLHLVAGGGKVRLPSALPTLVVQSAEAQVSINRTEGRIELERTTLVTDDVELHAVGKATETGDRRRLSLSVSAPEASVETVLRYWPSDAGASARRWVADNIKRGRVRNVAANLGGELDADNAFKLGGLDGSFDFDGLSVRFLDSMPPVEQTAGRATFSPAGFDFTVQGASLPGLRVTRGAVKIGGLDVDRPRLSVATDVEGGVADVVELLQREPIGLDLHRENVGGSVASTIGLAFALDKPVDLASLGLTVSAKLKATRVAGLVSWEIDDGAFDLGIRDRSLSVNGSAHVGGALAKIDLKRSLEAAGSTSVKARATLDDKHRAGLGFDTGNWVRGPVAITAEVQSAPDGTNAVQLDLDLGEATIDGGLEAFTKPAGVPGQAEARFRVDHGRVTRVDRLRFGFAHTEFTGSARRGAERWQMIEAQASVAANKKQKAGRAGLSVLLEGKSQHFRLNTENTGRWLSFTQENQFRGGSGTMAGSIDLDRAPLTANARVEVQNMTVLDAPMVARIVGLASVSGLYDALVHDGLLFQSIAGDLSYRNGMVEIRRGIATTSDALFQIEGNIDVANQKIDLKGTLVPSYYGINQAPSKVPLIGGLLGKLTGGAIQAFDFQVLGKLAEPDVRVNASSLAPGALRDLIRAIER